MISIIICSVSQTLYGKLEENIKDTIGNIVYEIIRMDNLNENLQITKAYNLGIERAKYNYLLFIHEDICFKTPEWGLKLSNTLEIDNVGLVGVAGSRYKSKHPSAFWHTLENQLVMHLIQHYNNKEKELINIGFNNSTIEDVTIVDGVFLAFKKSIKIMFDENIPGFHGYDIGLCIDVLEKQKRIIVSKEILIEHFSNGNTSEEFIYSLISLHKLNKKRINKILIACKSLDKIALNKFLTLSLHNRIVVLSVWKKYLKIDFFNKLNIEIFKLWIFNFLFRK